MIRQLLVLSLVGLALCAPSNKICGQLQQVLLAKGSAHIVVSFSETDAVLHRVDSMRFVNRGAKITFMKSLLEELQATDQKNALNLLRSRSVQYESLWINNRMYINNASPELVQAIAALDEVTDVREEIVVQLEVPVQADNSTINAEWGIDKIEAQQAHAWHTSDSAYNTISGTSMACPHAAGTVALLLGRSPSLSYAQVKALLQNNCDRNLGSAATCGGTPPTTFPNNIYGYGRINARKSLAAAIGGF